MSRPIQLGKAHQIRCLGYGGKLQFITAIPHGKQRRRNVTVEMQITQLRELAKVFDGWPDDYLGHAWWHHQHPDDKMPCDSCPPAIKSTDSR